VLNHFGTSERPVPTSRCGNGKRKLEATLFDGNCGEILPSVGSRCERPLAYVGDYDVFAAGCYLSATGR
jgi:hypothetical protein